LLKNKIKTKDEEEEINSLFSQITITLILKTMNKSTLTKIRNKNLSLVYKICSILFIIFLCKNKSSAQCLCTPTSTFPAVVGGVSVSVTNAGDVTDYGATWSSCGLTAGPGWVGSSGSFTQTYTFSSPVNNIGYVITAASGSETFSFTVGSGVLTATQCGGTCPFSQVGNSFTCLSNDDGTIVLLNSSSSYTSFTVFGPGGSNGSLVALCVQSISVSISPSYQICAGNSATIIPVNSAGLTSPSYSLNPGGLTNSTGSFVVNPTSTTNYTAYITGTNSSGSVVTTTGNSTVTVNPLPIISPTFTQVSCTNTLNSVNLNLTFNPVAPTPTYAVMWSPPPATIAPSQTFGSGLNPGITSVTVTAAGGCVASASFTMLGITIPTFTLTNNTGSYSLTCNNPTINLSVATNYTPTANFNWINNTATFTSSLTNVSLTGASNAGTYTVSLTDPVTACSTSQTFAIGQNAAIPVNTVSPGSQVITCNAGAATFTSTISSPTINVTSSWFYNSTTFPTGPSLVTNGSVSIGAPTSPGTIIVQTCNNVNGCCNTKTLTVTASTNVPTFNATSSTNFTLGCASPVNVTQLCINPTSAGAVNFLFLPPTSTLSVPIPTVLFSGTSCTTTALPGTWTLVARDPNSNCQTPLPVVVLSNTVAPDVSAGILTQTLTCVNPTVLAVGTSSTPNTDLGWLIPSAPFSLPTPTITLGPITAGATNTNLPNFYATYTAVATNTINQCKSTQTYSIYQNFFAPSNIGIGVSTPSNITCQNLCVSLSFTGATLSYPGGVSIPTNTWSAPPPTSNTSTLSTTSACVAGDYTLTVTDGISGCAASKVYKVIEQLDKPVLANLPSYTLDCSATSSITAAQIQIALTNSLSGGWSILIPFYPTSAGFSIFNLTNFPNGYAVTPSGANTVTFSVDAIGDYGFIVKNIATGCSQAGKFTVTKGSLNADFSPSTLLGYAPLPVNFSNLSSSSSTTTGTSSITTVWSFGNGTAQTTTATNIGTNATYNNPGTYTVTIVSTKGNCIDSAHKIIRVDIPSKLEIPNVFTPNRDGSNDVFFLKTSNLTEITALIFDRWGNKVYDLTSTTGNIAWDGKNLEGKECAAGTYFYIIKATGKDGQAYEKKGNVSLYR
jgi:gliding motility-associated-like protein